jgi:ribosomal protein S10
MRMNRRIPHRVHCRASIPRNTAGAIVADHALIDESVAEVLEDAHRRLVPLAGPLVLRDPTVVMRAGEVYNSRAVVATQEADAFTWRW